MNHNSSTTVINNLTSTISTATNGSTTSSMSASTNTTTSVTTNVSTSTRTTTQTTTSTNTTANITANICLAGYTNSIQLLYLNMTSYLNKNYYEMNFTSPNVTSLTLMFSFRTDPNFWYLDNVVVANSSGQQLLSNGNFEQGTLAKWVYCNPSNASYSGGIVSSSSYCYGSYCYRDGSVGAFDYLSQNFTVNAYQTYTVGFYVSIGSTFSVTMTFASINILY